MEYCCDCSDLDEVVVFHDDGKFIITKVADKKFVGKNIILVEVFKRGDDRHIYNMCYVNGTGGSTMVKRFAIGGVSRDKEYDLTKGKAGSKVTYFTSNPNGEAEVIRVKLKPKAKLKKREFDYDFSHKNEDGSTVKTPHKLEAGDEVFLQFYLCDNKGMASYLDPKTDSFTTLVGIGLPNLERNEWRCILSPDNEDLLFVRESDGLTKVFKWEGDLLKEQ